MYIPAQPHQATQFNVFLQNFYSDKTMKRVSRHNSALSISLPTDPTITSSSSATNRFTSTTPSTALELSDQVAHIKKLETLTREQNTELKQYRKQHKAIEVVEEEKRSLQAKLRKMDDLERRLGEAELRMQVLEEERHSWTSIEPTEFFFFPFFPFFPFFLFLLFLLFFTTSPDS
ncbi:unnamed protein product [Alternaria alternata]|jgi:hypothetical protein|uniref:uncharacterized protein n=1 Tax=Alternaria postmessia TaxID=1187938 RepID=UPI0010E13E06|nr:uncharacterized protein J4E82_010136 [Alternaria postmessia]KAI5369085.1 hypothetical protein J4E82_010136 [Alternaria postmessia]RYN89834.1 hypothetical protein AA0120_g6273 [Alternaria tenuissima]RYO68578.1 hypothetical protein AA0116_g208 [Alternaria tenuissima]